MIKHQSFHLNDTLSLEQNITRKQHPLKIFLTLVITSSL